MTFEDWIHCIAFECPCERIGEDMCQYERLADRLNAPGAVEQPGNKTVLSNEDDLFYKDTEEDS
jgi:hypothetical protein